MGGFFSLDSKFMQAMSRVADLIILNVIYLVTCLPVVTIGAAGTAMYTVCFRLGTDREGSLVKGYFRAFRDEEAIQAATLRELHEQYKPIVLEAVTQDIRYRNALRFSACRAGFSACSISSGRVARWAYTLNIKKLSYPLARAMRWALCKVGSRASGDAVDGLMPTQISGFLPRVPKI